MSDDTCSDETCEVTGSPMCPVHGMTPDEAYEAAKGAAEGATVAAGGWCAPSVESPAEARERWKELTFHEHYGLSGRDGDMSVVVCPPEGLTAGLVRDAVQAMRDAPRGHWAWRSVHADDGWRWVREWVED